LIKLSLLSRKLFLAFKQHAKDGHIKAISHRNHGDSVSLHLIRRICSRRIGQSLTSLDFQFSAVTDDHFAIASLPATLESLNLNSCQEITEKTLVQVSRQCPGLKRIELYWHVKASDFGVKKLAACTNLTVVNLSGCKYLTDKSIIPLVQACTLIEVLNLTRISGVTCEAVKQIATKLPQLRELFLYADSGVSNEGFAALADESTSVVKKLEILELCGC